MKIQAKVIAITLCVLAIGYQTWIEFNNSTIEESKTINVFPADSAYKNYALTGDLTTRHVAKYFKVPYTAYEVERASFGDVGGDYLEFKDCTVDSRKEQNYCQAYHCNNDRNIAKIENGETPSANDLLSECGKTLSDWRLEISK